MREVSYHEQLHTWVMVQELQVGGEYCITDTWVEGQRVGVNLSVSF